MNLPAANSGGSAAPAPPPPVHEFFLVLPDGSCIPATAKSRKTVMRQARSESRKRAKAKRMAKAAEIQMALEERAAARRLLQELAELERGSIRWAARFKARVKPGKPESRTSPVEKRLTITPMVRKRGAGAPRPASSWVVDEFGMRGIIWQQSYLGRKSPKFYRGAARDNWEYDVRDEAVLLDGAGEPVIISNMGEDWVEIGAAWQAIEDASTRKNAKIQIRAIAPFDSDMSEAEMAAALTHFCETVLAPLGVPYSAVIHRPPEQGDERNFHPHISFALRPTRRVEAYCWDIADEVCGELDGRDGVQMLRHLWAHSMSEAAERLGHAMIYTGRGYGARGLPLEAGEHLGEHRSAMVRRGERVWAHERNRLKTARNRQRIAIRALDKKIASLSRLRDAVIAQQEAEAALAKPTPARRLVSAKTMVVEPETRQASVPLQSARPAMTEMQAPRPATLTASPSNVSETAPRPPNEPVERTRPALASSAKSLRAPTPLVASVAPIPGVATPLRAASEVAQSGPDSLTRAALATRGSGQVLARSVEASTTIERLIPSQPSGRPHDARRVVSKYTSRNRRPLTPAATTSDAALRHALTTSLADGPPVTGPARSRTTSTSPDEPRKPLAVSTAPTADPFAATLAALRLLVDRARAARKRKAAQPSTEVKPQALPEPATVKSQVHAASYRRSLLAGEQAMFLANLPDRAWLERHPLQPFRPAGSDPEGESRAGPEGPRQEVGPRDASVTSDAPAPASMAVDEGTAAGKIIANRLLDLLRRADPYVFDDRAGRFTIDPRAQAALKISDEELDADTAQAALRRIREGQQVLFAALVAEANNRPLAFSKTGRKPWPRDLDPAMLSRLDRWAGDDGFQQDLFVGVELPVAEAHRAKEARHRAAAAEEGASERAKSATRLVKPIPDGFGGVRTTPAPTFVPQEIVGNVRAFEPGTGKPTPSLLMLARFAGEKPAQVERASDGRLMAAPGAPAMMADLLARWRHEDEVDRLVTTIVTESRKAGRPVWPPNIAAVLRVAHATGSRPPPDLSRGPIR